MKYLYLLPFGTIDKQILEKLAIDLQKKLSFSVKTVSSIEVPDYTYNELRRQYDGDSILRELNRLEFTDCEKILGICNVDLFSDGLNFIFGEAETPGRTAIISLFRLNKSQHVYFRALKEAIHELGHTFGLSHCPTLSCVMHFSNTILDTDLKNDDFCPKCKKLYEMARK